jgi:hypothetical protein
LSGQKEVVVVGKEEVERRIERGERRRILSEIMEWLGGYRGPNPW